jgi:hypothetical protein
MGRRGRTACAESEDTMTGPDHFRAAEQPLEHAASMLDPDAAPELRAELLVRQAVTATFAAARSRPSPRQPGSARTWTGPTRWRGSCRSAPRT